MIKNIILSGVGGQGILTIAAIIDHAAMHKGWYIKQAEVHGMSQRGGAVQSHLRISDKPIYSDLIPRGQADLILSLEPMEALRYLPFLSEDGTIITAIEPIKNIAVYPDEENIIASLKNCGHPIILIDAAKIAKEAGIAKAVNVVMAGAAANHIGIEHEHLKASIREMFANKGLEIVEKNLKAFNLGLENSIQ
jgi:indolepyruvate ferredoxin oxidoreductase, beta subunit